MQANDLSDSEAGLFEYNRKTISFKMTASLQEFPKQDIAWDFIAGYVSFGI
jgi:hypothetical protein